MGLHLWIELLDRGDSDDYDYDGASDGDSDGDSDHDGDRDHEDLWHSGLKWANGTSPYWNSSFKCSFKRLFGDPFSPYIGSAWQADEDNAARIMTLSDVKFVCNTVLTNPEAPFTDTPVFPDRLHPQTCGECGAAKPDLVCSPPCAGEIVLIVLRQHFSQYPNSTVRLLFA